MQFSGWSGEFLKIACSWFTFCFCAFLKFLVVVKGAEWRTCWRWANTRGVNCNIFSHTRKENAWKAEIFERFSSFFFAFFFVNRDNGGGRTCVCVCVPPPQKGFCLTLLFTGEEALRACRSRVCVFSDSRLCTAGNSLFIFIRPNGGWVKEEEWRIKKNRTRIHQDQRRLKLHWIAIVVKNGKSIKVINKIHFAIK